MMKAVRVHEFGGPQVLKVQTDVPVPAINDTQVNFTTSLLACSIPSDFGILFIS